MPMPASQIKRKRTATGDYIPGSGATAAIQEMGGPVAERSTTSSSRRRRQPRKGAAEIAKDQQGQEHLILHSNAQPDDEEQALHPASQQAPETAQVEEEEDIHAIETENISNDVVEESAHPVLQGTRWRPRASAHILGDIPVMSGQRPERDQERHHMMKTRTTQARPIPYDNSRQQRERILQQPTRQAKQPTSKPAKRQKMHLPHTHLRRMHPLFWVGIALMVPVLWGLLVVPVGSWIGEQLADTQYGSIHTYQLDAVAGHQDSPANPTHFTAINLKGEIVVFELQGGQAKASKVYVAYQQLANLGWSHANKAIVTLETHDVNGDGKPDLIVHVFSRDLNWLFQPEQAAEVVFLNTGATFKPQQAA